MNAADETISLIRNFKEQRTGCFSRHADSRRAQKDGLTIDTIHCFLALSLKH